MTKIIKSGAEVLFTPQYYNKVALIVQQAHELGGINRLWAATARVRQKRLNFVAKPVTGFSSAPIMLLPGATKAFIERYNKKHGYVPDYVGALRE